MRTFGIRLGEHLMPRVRQLDERELIENYDDVRAALRNSPLLSGMGDE